MVDHMTKQMNRLERMVVSSLESAQLKSSGNFPMPSSSSSSSSYACGNRGPPMVSEEEWSRPRKQIEAARMQQQIVVTTRGGYQEGGAELILESTLSSGSDDGEVIRQCNACGAAVLGTLSIPTKKRLFSRLIDMMERNNFILQILPWFQTAFNLRLLHQVLASPGTYARAVRVFQKYSSAGRTSLAADCMKLYQFLASEGGGGGR